MVENFRIFFLVMGDDRESGFAIDAKPFGEGLPCVVVPPVQSYPACGAGITDMQHVEGSPVGRAAGGTGQTIENPAGDLLLTQIKEDHEIDRDAAGVKHSIKMLRLSHRAGKTVQQEAGPVIIHPSLDHSDGQFVGHEETAACPGISFQTECGTAGAFGAQQCAGGDVWNSESAGEAICLRTLPRGRRTQQQDPLLGSFHEDWDLSDES